MISQNENVPGGEPRPGIADFCRQIAGRKCIIIGCLLLGTAIGGIVTLLTPTIYVGELLMNITLKEKGKEMMTPREIAETLGVITQDQIARIYADKPEAIHRVRIVPIAGSTDKFKAVIEVTNASYFDDFAKVFESYLNNLPLVLKGSDQVRQSMIKRKEAVEQIIRNSEKDLNRSAREGERRSLNIISFNPVEYHKALMDLKLEKDSLTQSLRGTGKAIETISVNGPSRKPVQPKPLLYMSIASAIGLMVGLLASAFIVYIRDYKDQ
jgi:hypothetical protein